MSGLTSQELARIRADIEADQLPDTCNILSLTQTSDGAGGLTDTWGTLTVNVPCRMDRKRGGERIAAGAVNYFEGWILTVGYDATLTTAHRVEYGGESYNVIAVSGGSWKVNIRAEVELV